LFSIPKSRLAIPTLYLVGTPIGNLEDITLRALRILSEVSLIAAEDTRTTGRLLQHFDIVTPMASYHDYSSQDRIASLIEKLDTSDVAIVSEAGMPGLSDPGYRLVRAAIEAGIPVIPIPGPSAAVAALVASGIPSDRFLFLGFLPRRSSSRRDALAEVAELPYTLVFYEAPHRLLNTLDDILAVIGDRQLSIGREITKMHEEIWRGRTRQALDDFSLGRIRGEITLVIEGATTDQNLWSEDQVRDALAAEISKGLSRKDVVKLVANQSGWRKREVYQLSLREGLDET
jgi:16S rRNA (cytidine1402-2'-O)-methyltransferase